MGFVLLGALVVVIILVIIWMRLSAVRSDRHSMEAYGHALGALGDAARRSDPGGSVRILPKGETGAPHVRRDATPAAARYMAPTRTVPPARREQGVGDAGGVGAPPRGPVPTTPARRWPSVSIPVPESDLKFDDRSASWPGGDSPTAREPGDRRAPTRGGDAGRSGVVAYGAAATAAGARSGSPASSGSTGSSESAGPSGDETQAVPRQSAALDYLGAEALPDDPAGVRREAAAQVNQPEILTDDELNRQVLIRRVSVGAIAAVALTLVIVASLLLTGSPKPKSAAKSGSSGNTHPSSTTTTLPQTTTTSAPAVLNPIPSETGVVSYSVPKGPYTLAFNDMGSSPAWVGVETADGGNVLWSNTLQPQQSATYGATGPVAVDMGVPGAVGITVNGVPVKLPPSFSGNTVAFTPPS